MDIKTSYKVINYFHIDSSSELFQGKEKILVCSDCRCYFKCYGEFPCLEPPGQHAESPDPVSNEEELDFEEDIDEKPILMQTQSSSLGGELNLTAIERDSDLAGENPDFDAEDLVSLHNF